MRQSILLVAGATAVATSCSQESAELQRPNIIFFLVDDLGYADLGYGGLSDYYETPNIDSFIAQNTYFTNSYAAASNSAPARSCLMTGMYSPRHGVYTVNPPDRGEKTKRKFFAAKNNIDVAAEFYTMAEMLSDVGYNCGQIGKWHLGDDEFGTGPLSQGFQHNIAGERAGMPFSYFYPYVNQKSNKSHIGLEEGKPGEYLTDRLTDEAIKFMRQERGDQPFFLYLAHHGVHTPIKAPQDLVDKYERKAKGKYHNDPVYAAMIESVDDSFGRVCDMVKQMGIDDNTVIIFYSDNGGSAATNNSPLRSMKGTPYEGGCRVPLAIKWAGKGLEAQSVDIPVSGIDFYKTFAEELSGSMPADLDGENIFTLIEEQNYERDLFWHFPAYLESYLSDGDFRSTPYTAMRSGDWKLIYFYESESCELYNLREDIGETKNLASTEKEQCDKMYQRMRAWLERVDAPTTFELNPDYTGNL